MRMRRRYTEEQKANALAALTANQMNFNGTATQLGIPRNTLKDWHQDTERLIRQDRQIAGQGGANLKAKDAENWEESRKKLPGRTVAELRQDKKEDLAGTLMDIAWMCAGRLVDSAVLEDTKRPTDLSTVMGTVIDKARLLKGESTVITEQKIANHRWAEEELQKVMREFQMDRETALGKIKEYSPTWSEMLQ